MGTFLIRNHHSHRTTLRHVTWRIAKHQTEPRRLGHAREDTWFEKRREVFVGKFWKLGVTNLRSGCMRQFSNNSQL